MNTQREFSRKIQCVVKSPNRGSQQIQVLIQKVGVRWYSYWEVSGRLYIRPLSQA